MEILSESHLHIMRRFFALVTFCFTAGILSAHPMEIDFDEMIAKSKSIFIAHFISDNLDHTEYKLAVESVLKGHETQAVVKAGKAYGRVFMEKNTRFIAFINEKNQLEWAGFSDSLETGLISLHGFYDYNSYDVDPDAVSLVQLRQFIHEHKYDGSIDGNLSFMNYGTMQQEKTPVHFHISYTYHSGDKVSTECTQDGLNLVDFTNKPSIYFWGSGLRLTYEENEVRPLEIDGYVDSVNADGKSCRAYFNVWEPEDLDRQAFFDYISHPEYGPPFFEIELCINDSMKYPFFYNVNYGFDDYLQYGKTKLKTENFDAPTRDQKGMLSFGGPMSPVDIEASLDSLPDEPRFSEFHGSGTIYFIRGLRIAPWKGTATITQNGKKTAEGKCTVTLKATHFNKNVNYGK
ncbi:MAG TPA: hypothetical protein VFU15_16320 [Bacteroidia bacterium]|nr:hypothetical protein [Bacteroidia bacterium]